LKSIILASASPRRKALLADLGISFEVLVTSTEEIDSGGPPASIVESNARNKCMAAAARSARSLIIAADTLVFLEEQVLSKPRNLEDARRMLRLLSGNTHQVVTGLALCDTETGCFVQGSESTDVTFRLLSEDEINCFVDTVKPLDRAGAYTVDGPGSLLVSRYDGCYQNVLGLPMVRLDKLMRQLGHSLFDYIDPAKARFL
jgi:septum formation protein